MHQQHAADPLALFTRRVQEAHAGLELARVDAAEGERAHEGVVHDLERQDRERLVVGRLTGDGLFGLVVDARRRGDVHRRRQIIDHGVEQGLHALVLEGRAREDRIEGAREHGLTDALLQHRFVRLLAFEVGFHRLVVEFDGVLDQVVAGFFAGRLHVGRDLFVVVVGAEPLGLPHHGLHADQVDDALQGGFRTDRQLDRDRLHGQALTNGAQAHLEVGAGLVHLVDEHDARNVVAVGLTPDGFRLRLNTLVAVEHRHAAVQDPQAAFDFDGEVHVPGGVDDVQAMAVPERGGRGGGDRDATLLLLLHPVHGRGAVVDFADLMALAGVVQDPLGGRGLPGVDVRHDPEVAVIFDLIRAGHCQSSAVNGVQTCGAGGLAQTTRARKADCRIWRSLLRDRRPSTSGSARRRGWPRPSYGCLRAS